MVSVLEKFVTVRETRGDVLRPDEYRSIVEMIKGVLKNYKFLELSQNHKAFVEHINNFNDPHHNPKITHFDEIVKSTYEIYVLMSRSPLSFERFKTDIVPTLEFIELIRRIVLNRSIYDQVRKWDGSVSRYGEANLSEDWGIRKARSSPNMLYFGRRPANESDFIKLSIDSNPDITRDIFSAESLKNERAKLPVVFETSAAIPYFSPDFQPTYNIGLLLANNDLTVQTQISGIPDQATSVFSFTNGIDTVEVVMGRDGLFTFLFNQEQIAKTDVPMDVADITLALSGSGFYTFQVTAEDTRAAFVGGLTFRTPLAFNRATIGVPVEDIYDPRFGLRYLTIYSGNDSNFRFVYIVDENGDLVIDDNGDYLIEFGGFLYVVDANGRFVVDANGRYIVDDTEVQPDYSEYLYLRDSDGNYIADADGDLIYELAYHYTYKRTNAGVYARELDIEISSAYTCIVDQTDGAFYEDADGALIVDAF